MTSAAAGALHTPDDRTLRTGFLRWAQTAPEAPALVVEDRTLTYGDLERTARTWAAAIIELAGRPPERVGVFAYRSEVAYTGVLAALAAGAAFVPLNPTFPAGRTRAMIAQSNLDAIIVDRRAAKQLSAVFEGLSIHPPLITPELDALDGLTAVRVMTRADLATRTPLATLPDTSVDGIAYLLFTSGSTGIPKGVPVTHRNVRHFLDFVSARYNVRPEDRFSQTFDQTFDLSVFDLFAAWDNGACVCALQPLDLLAPARFVTRHGVTVWFSVPSLAALMRKKNLLKPNVFSSLRWSLFCGEPLPRASAEAWQAAAPASIVENLYGPTELTVACLTHRWDPAGSPAQCLNDIVPIGRPFDGLTAVVLNDDLQTVPAGEAGELCVSGPQTVPGYWNAPDKTAERFVVVAGPDGRQERFYRTGDRVRELESGEYVYLGRTDHQVKVLGHRVELSEVEGALSRNGGVTQAVALGWPVRDGSAEGLVAFVTGTGLDPQGLTRSVRDVLPDYMTPRAVLVLETLPLNVNGKIDRNALRQRLEAGEYAGQV
jgi:amino acid adenylation domain-containing protein